MAPRRESLPGVTAAGAIAIAFASFEIFGCFMMILVMYIGPALTAGQPEANLPPPVRSIMIVVYLFFLALAVGQFIVGINVLRRRNWARITIILWGALMAILCAVILVVTLFVFNLPVPENAQTRNVGPILVLVKTFTAVFYGIPIGVGVWWMILFTRPRVVAAFQNSATAHAEPLALDASGFPASASAPSPLARVPASAARKHSIPIPIAVVAAFDAYGAFSMILALFLPLPLQAPLFLFGMRLEGFPQKLFLATAGVLYTIFIVGIFKLKRWGLDSLLILKSLILAGGIVSLFSPHFMEAMDEMVTRFMPKNATFPAGTFPFGHSFMEALFAFSYIFGIGLMILALIYRGRFLKAAAEPRL